MKKNKMKWSNVGVKIAIVAGFVLLYLASMFLSTYLKQEQYRANYIDRWSETCSQIYTELHDSTGVIENDAMGLLNQQKVKLEFNNDGTLSEKSKDYLEYIITNSVIGMERYFLLGYTISDMKGNLIAQTSDQLMYADTRVIQADGSFQYSKIRMEDYFTPAQIDKIRGYYEKACRFRGNIGDFLYDCLFYYDYNAEKMVYFSIIEKELVKILDNNQYSYKNENVFLWKNPEYEPIEHYDTDYVQLKTSLSLILKFPYLHEGEETWKKWKNDDFLHDNVEKDEIIIDENGFVRIITDGYGFIDYALNRKLKQGEHVGVFSVVLSDQEGKEQEFLIQGNLKMYPWQAAMEELKDIYLYGALFVTICLIVVLYVTDKTNRKQEKLEETRRDFTNAIAHELKTPLTIVRGLVENMEEEESEEQKASYRKELVNQTEIMDDLVKEMIFISKLDSDKIILKEDQISVFSIIEDQMKKLEHPIEEKNLLVQYWKEEDFIIKGDKSYLEKAMFNLLENAVSHNKPDGKISISLEKDKCIIENTADSIEEENLPHICELFFTGDKSRNSDENHKGLGLYLVKKIFDLHGIELKIENTDVGVKVTIS